MSDINRLVFEQGYDNPDNLFSSKKPDEHAKYTPKFLNNVKNVQKKVVNGVDWKSLLKISPTKIKGTDISVDANDDEREADAYLRKTGRMK